MSRSGRTVAESALQEQFASRRVQPGEAGHEAFSRFLNRGLPGKTSEAWRYTDLRSLMHEAFEPVNAGGTVDVRDDVFVSVSSDPVLLINGRLELPPAGGMRLPPGVEVIRGGRGPAREAVLYDGYHDVIGDWNTAFVDETLIVRVGAGVKLDRPLNLMIASVGESSFAAHSCIRIEAGAGSDVSIIESHWGVGTTPCQVTHGVEQIIGESARLRYVRVQDMNLESQFLSTVDTQVGAGGSFFSFLLSTGAALSRHETRVRFVGEDAHADIGGVMLLSGTQIGDATVFVDHAMPRCRSRENYRFVLDDAARGVFQGRILVRPLAQKTDGKQSSRALMLSGDAEMDAKPELEIYADDVQCGHGATIGQLNHDWLFYLRTRGISEKMARSMLVQAFVGELLESVTEDSVRSVLSAHARSWLDEKKGSACDR